jgi:glycosyltransferase involved in cell wall biosynthesis
MTHPPLDLLCIEPTFPGRLGGVADWLIRRRGYRVRFFCQRAEPADRWPEATGRGIEVVQFAVGGIAKEPGVEWTRVLERSLCYSYGCWETLEGRRPRPVDIVLGRSTGLGSTLFAPVSLPAAPVVQLFDGYYDPARREPGDDDSHPEAYRQWRLAANAIELVELENGVLPWTPTEYQRGLFPPEYRGDFNVLHDGIETRDVPARHRGTLTVAGKTVPERARVVTFASRSLNYLRGFDRFVALVERLQGEFPDLIAIAAGSPVVDDPLDYTHYNRDYATPLLADHPRLDLERLWLPGLLLPGEFRRLLARSDLHFAPSRPGPASRSLLEAMAAGCVVLASDTEAHREILEEGRGGILADAGLDACYAHAARVFRESDMLFTLGGAASERIQMHYARDVTLPGLTGIFDRLLNEERFSPARAGL